LHGAKYLGRASAGATPLGVAGQTWNFSDLQSAVDFIRSQRATVNNRPGLPATFQVPAQSTFADATQERIVRQGSGLYDNALASLALIQNGNWDEAKSIFDVYLNDRYGNMQLNAVPNVPGASYEPFTSEASYFFNFTRTNGQFSDDWNFYAVNTGPNAWLSLALCRYVEALRATQTPRRPTQEALYLALARKLGNAMILLQDPATQGAVRFSPQRTVREGPDPYEEVNTENNISAYAALKALYDVTQDDRYRIAYENIERWLTRARLYNPLTRTFQTGMLDRDRGTLWMGARYNAAAQRWELQNVTAADSGGTWAISALGPERLDRLFGAGTTLQMWKTIRREMGRTADLDAAGRVTHVRFAGDQGRLDGFDFSSLFPENQSLISPEWSAGGVFALKQMVDYLSTGAGRNSLNPSELSALRSDWESIHTFLSSHSSAYAYGPGLTTARQGETGFGWKSPPENVTAMASVYAALRFDPFLPQPLYGSRGSGGGITR